MSLDISGSRYVKVFDPEMREEVSEKILFANLASGRKTGVQKKDKETGELVFHPVTNEPVYERAYSRYQGRFVGNALEAAKGLSGGETIDIISGWVVNEPYIGNDKKKHYTAVVTVTDFTLSDIEDSDDTELYDEIDE